MARASARQTAAKKVGARSRVRTKKAPVSARAKTRGSKSTSYHMVRKVRAKKPKTSGLEKLVEQWLIDEGIPYKTQKAISRVHCDLYLPETKTCVEVQGCFWHGHKACLPEGKKLTMKQVRKRLKDQNRFKFLQNAGYKVLLLWECDIHSDPEKVKETLFAYARPA